MWLPFSNLKFLREQSHGPGLDHTPVDQNKGESIISQTHVTVQMHSLKETKMERSNTWENASLQVEMEMKMFRKPWERCFEHEDGKTEKNRGKLYIFSLFIVHKAKVIV